MLSERFTEARKNSPHKTVTAFAEAARINRSMVYHYEAGREGYQQPGPDIIQRWADASGYSPLYLLNGTGPKTTTELNAILYSSLEESDTISSYATEERVLALTG